MVLPQVKPVIIVIIIITIIIIIAVYKFKILNYNS